MGKDALPYLQNFQKLTENGFSSVETQEKRVSFTAFYR